MHNNVDLPQIMLYLNINNGKTTMIYDLQTLKIKYQKYSNINQKIASECKKNNLVRVKRGLYTDNLKIDAPIIANICYGPSYISHEYALSYYGLIPEHVSVFTSACFNKKNNKTYSMNGCVLEYRSIPNEVFSYGIDYRKNDDGINYKIATKEKALCDTLYSKYPIRSIGDLIIMLFDDLRIDEDEFYKLNFDFILSISNRYHSNTLLILSKFIREIQNGKIN